MKIIFIDESEVNRKSKKEWFVISGISVEKADLIKLENKLRILKKELNLKNFKELRTERNIKSEDKLIITKRICSLLEDHNTKIVSTVCGNMQDKYCDTYLGALIFILERFYLGLKKESKNGIIICDSLPGKILVEVSEKARQYFLDWEIKMCGKSRGNFNELVYPSLLFLKDEHSEMIQICDLICTSVQNAVREFESSDESILPLKGNEDKLIEYNPHLKHYWALFEKDYNKSVSGWGIKTWN